jgi:hypothetical protein
MLSRPWRHGDIFAADGSLFGGCGPVCYQPHRIAGAFTCSGVLYVSMMRCVLFWLRRPQLLICMLRSMEAPEYWCIAFAIRRRLSGRFLLVFDGYKAPRTNLAGVSQIFRMTLCAPPVSLLRAQQPARSSTIRRLPASTQLPSGSHTYAADFLNPLPGSESQLVRLVGWRRI